MSTSTRDYVANRLLRLYSDHVPARNKGRFYAALAGLFIPQENPADQGDINPHPQRIMDTLDKLDALLEPYRPIPAALLKTRRALRKSCMDQISREQRNRFWREARELPL